jgi:hypothetical protein
MNMRAIAAVLLGLVISSLAVAGSIPGQITLYKSGAVPLPQNPQAAWVYSSNAYSAITIPAPFDRWKADGVQIKSAALQVVWKANSLNANTGVGIAVCPSQSGAENGLVGCTFLAFFAANDTSGPASYTPGCVSNPGGPFPCRTDVTSALQSFLAQGTSDLYFVLMTYGNGAAGPLVYDGEILIEWGT